MPHCLLLHGATPQLHAALAEALQPRPDLMLRAVSRVDTPSLIDDLATIALVILVRPSADFAADLAMWRRAGLTAPVLALGDAGALSVVEAIGLPARLGQLLERVVFYLNAAATTRPQGRFGAYILADGRLSRGAESVTLTDKEAALLALLMMADGRALPREELLAQIWGYGAMIETHTLETHIYRLRRKLQELGGDGDIASGAGGYQLIGGGE